MSAHKIAWTFDTHYVRSEVICEVESGPCRLDCTQGCDEWMEPYQVGDQWFHDIVNWNSSVTIATHAMRATGECGMKDWLSDTDETGAGEFVIAEVPIETTWHGDHFRWHKADEADR